MDNLYSNREVYRSIIKNKELHPFNISIMETDLHIQTSKKNLYREALASVKATRAKIKDYINSYPEFETSLKPIIPNRDTEPIIKNMMDAGIKADVGPMASVAGAVSQETGKHLLKFCDQIIIENGGDIFVKTKNEFITGIYAGVNSPFSNKIGIRLQSSLPLGICTSSGTLGHSLSFGKADAVTIISENAYIADAFATSVCNMVKEEKDMEKALDFANNRPYIKGAVIIINDKIGAIGDLELIRL